MASQDSSPIPQPPPTLFIGNALEIDPINAPASFRRLAEIYGEIYQLDLPGSEGKTIVLSSHETVSDCCDAGRFEKPLDDTLKQVRVLAGDGLFTAYPREKSWGIAHRLLMPVFGPLGIRKMFPGMVDIASQMLLKWDRLGPDNEIVCSDDFTRLAFDVIGLCAFGYRFNNFYSEHTHPFIDQMVEVLIEAGKRASRFEIENKIRVFSAATLHENVKRMHELCDQIIEDRVANPQPEVQDLLNPMLNAVDKETGEKMTLENVRYNMVTFLVAGHETTSGTFGVLFYYLLKNPEKYFKAQQEVDEVLGDKPLELNDISRLVYLKYAIFEALRCFGPIPQFVKQALKRTKIAGKYAVEPEDQILIDLHGLHHDPKIWGDDAHTYRPERFLDGGWERLPKDSWKPFGDGDRACIGRAFAQQELLMVSAMILQNFQVELVDPAYNLQVKVTLTQKVHGLSIKVRRRPGRSLSNLSAVGVISTTSNMHRENHHKRGHEGKSVPAPVELRPMTVLYGSNAGTCKSYAEDIGTNAPRYGFKANVNTLDSATEDVPKDQPIIIIEPSYEGKPADNARKFTSHLERNTTSQHMVGVKYAVFGVGNSDWTHTFHRIPKLTDELMAKTGGQRILPFGSVDVKGDIMGPWEDWQENLFSALRRAYGETHRVDKTELRADITPPKFAALLGGHEAYYGIVKINRETGGRGVGLIKKHMEIELPVGTSYRSGDYMAILPLNNISTVMRVIKRFGLSPDDEVSVSGTEKAFLSSDAPISIFDLLSTRVELSTPISQRQIKKLVEAAPAEYQGLDELATDAKYTEVVLPKRFSVLDILEDHPKCQLPLAAYLNMLKPLTPRQYSISSSPLAKVEFVKTTEGSGQRLTATLTYDVHDEAAWSEGGRQFYGAASTYLADQEPGNKLRCFARATNVNFHLPSNYLVPLIMVCAGTGIAPMRGFIQERATIKAARNEPLGPAILYFGCRHHKKDYLYRDELEQWEAEGVVSVRPCFSKVGPDGESPQYVPDRMWEDRDELAELFGEQNAKIFVCGSASKLAKGTEEVCKKIWLAQNEDSSQDDAQAWLEKVKEDRYVSDVFA